MVTGFEGALVKPMVDAILKLVAKARHRRFRRSAESSLSQAIRELLSAPSDLRSIEAKLAVVRAAELVSPEQLLAEEMLYKHKAALRKSPAKKAAKKAPAKKATKKAAKKVAKKKAASKRQ